MIISVWYQPAWSFAKWKARGVTTLFGWETEGTDTPAQLDAWCVAAKAAGLTYILQASAAAHWTDPECVGVFLEPDGPNSDHPLTPAQVQANAATLRTKTTKPLYLTLNGGALLTQSDADVKGWCDAADVICFWSYPFNYGKGSPGISEIPNVLDKLNRLTNNKTTMLIAEGSDQGIYNQDWTKGNDATGTPLAPKMRGPTGDEMSMMIGIGMAHGVDQVCWFDTKVDKGFGGFDGSNADEAAAQTAIDAKLNAPPPIVTHTDTPTPTPAPVTPLPPAPGGYGNIYIHLRTYDNWKTWRVVVP